MSSGISIIISAVNYHVIHSETNHKARVFIIDKKVSAQNTRRSYHLMVDIYLLTLRLENLGVSLPYL